MLNESVPLLMLMQTKGIGPRSLGRLLDQLERDHLSLNEFLDLDEVEMVERFHLTGDQAVSLHADREGVVSLADALESHGIRTVRRGSEVYPSRLDTVLGEKAPPVLFLAGRGDLLQRRAAGFCGARDASAQGLRCAEAIARALAGDGFLIVSGHAPGVDETAHRAALEAGGSTAFVLPEGILHFRPRASLGELLAEERFCVVSEFPPRLPWSVSNAMQRNRTICGLASALIVVEAGTSGGTWEAGLEALRLNVPLFVLTFEDAPPSAQGNSVLVKKGGVALPCRSDGLPELGPLRETLENPEAENRSLF